MIMAQRVAVQSIVLLVPSLEPGGAERQVVELALGLARHGHRVVVMVFRSGGAFEADLKLSNVRLISLEKGTRWNVVSFIARFLRELHKERPSILYGYLSTPNLMAILVKPLLRRTRIVWGIRASNLDWSAYDRFSGLIDRLESRLAGIPDLIVTNSYEGKTDAVARGFPAQKMVVIHNGIDVVRFQPDASARRQVRAEWGVGESDRLIGLVARFDPMKDHPTFLRAAAEVARVVSNVRFAIVGGGQSDYEKQLKEIASGLPLSSNLLIWAGTRNDIQRINSALDIACSSSSYGEGFSNAIAEAMACGVPCVVTNVGDSTLIVGDTGVVVPRSSPGALSDALVRLLAMPASELAALGVAARARIVSEFSTERLVEKTEEVLGLR
jgi:glycosyltransferase involved in cell wall biosynthesis